MCTCTHSMSQYLYVGAVSREVELQDESWDVAAVNQSVQTRPSAHVVHVHRVLYRTDRQQVPVWTEPAQDRYSKSNVTLFYIQTLCSILICGLKNLVLVLFLGSFFSRHPLLSPSYRMSWMAALRSRFFAQIFSELARRTRNSPFFMPTASISPSAL